jgi:hypothetical protein
MRALRWNSDRLLKEWLVVSVAWRRKCCNELSGWLAACSGIEFHLMQTKEEYRKTQHDNVRTLHDVTRNHLLVFFHADSCRLPSHHDIVFQSVTTQTYITVEPRRLTSESTNRETRLMELETDESKCLPLSGDQFAIDVGRIGASSIIDTSFS